jgi:hypothetical protein
MLSAVAFGMWVWKAVRTGSVFVRQRADAIALQPLSPGLAVVSERNRLA